MSRNLVEWLGPWRRHKGLVCPWESNQKREQKRLGLLLPTKRWGKNPLRHSWVSYRSAETSNLPLVADEAGNSTEVSRNAYRNPRMKRAAAEWFAIFPPDYRPENVIDLAANRPLRT